VGLTVEIRMREYGDVEVLDTELPELSFKDVCVLKTEYGTDYGRVVSHVKKSGLMIPAPEKPVKIIRKAAPADMEQISKNRVQAVRALKICREKAGQYLLPMKLLACEYSFDGEKLLFYFTAPERVDFRSFVRELASIFKVRIELRQIGPRDEAKIIGGIAPCGKTDLCCTQFMKSFFPVTTRMAKIQRLPVHQEKLLGLCGQLKCCLKFELDTYEILSASLPKEGTRVSTKQGKGIILSVDVIRQWVLIRLEDDRQVRCMSDEVSVLRE